MKATAAKAEKNVDKNSTTINGSKKPGVYLCLKRVHVTQRKLAYQTENEKTVSQNATLSVNGLYDVLH